MGGWRGTCLGRLLCRLTLRDPRPVVVEDIEEGVSQMNQGWLTELLAVTHTTITEHPSPPLKTPPLWLYLLFHWIITLIKSVLYQIVVCMLCVMVCNL